VNLSNFRSVERSSPFEIMVHQASVIYLRDFFNGKAGNGPDDFLFLQWQWPVFTAVTYVIGKFALEKYCRKLNTDGSSLLFQAFVAIHSLLLCIYSGWTAFYVWSYLINSYKSRGFFAAYCDYGYKDWDAGLGKIYYYFYLSKVWEFLDTVILIVKRKPVSVLQFYHHCGALIAMWGLLASSSNISWDFVAWNSVVHTIMYAYYVFTALKLPWPFPKMLITQVQLVQFFLGLGTVLPLNLALFGYNYFRKDWIGGCTSEASAIGILFTSLYVLPLIVLFINFYVQSYLKPKDKKPKEEKHD